MSAGATISFAIECYERGILTKKDTDGLELTWGNHAAIVALTEKMAKREGFGVILADGSKIAAQRIGKGAEEYAIQIGGQEVGYHDPKMEPSLAVSYIIDATPGRHTQGHEGLVPPGVIPEGSYDIGCYDNRGEAHKRASNMFHVINSLGICQLHYVAISHINGIIDTLNEITGWDTTLEELLETGERIACIRHAFNLREGINPLKLNVPDRFIGKPPQEMGPNAGITVDIETMEKDYLKCMEWDFKTCKPSRKKLEQLGLTDIAKDLWG
jgi:aldehyde:ferredoxin oxidoreductase